MNPNYGEIICESVKIINESLLAGLQYDQTVRCTVVDASKADQGEYRVSNGSSSFIAYSTDKFSNGANVYVTIPKGDYSNDKLIVGKVASATQEPFNYIAPFDNFLDITDNLVAVANFNTATGLLANDDRKPDEGYLYKKLFTIDSQTLGDKGLEGFTRLGLRASFRTDLYEQFNCILGNYGLWLEITFRGLNTVANDNNGGTYIKNLYFDTEDMVGNPYAFESYFSQEKLFDIENLGSIININVYFYQDRNSFYDQNKYLVPCKSIEDDFDDIYLPNNLFVKNIHIAAGFDISNSNEEFVQLYTLDALTYSSKVDDNVNTKEILLRWMHKTETDKKPMNETISDKFEIRWYRHKLGAVAPDEYAGVNWEFINLENDGTCGRRFKATLQPDTTLAQEQVKVIILYGELPGYYAYEILPFENKEQFLKEYADYYILDNKTNQYRKCNKEDWSDETPYTYYYKIDNRYIYRSDPIIFTNEVDVPSKATLEALSSLTLECYDWVDKEWIPTYGNYLLYNEQNDLIDKSQANIQRLIKWTLNLDGFKSENVSEVIWEFPETNTMLKKVIKYNEVENISEGLTYYIGNHYSMSNTNNTINCKVVHNGVTYSASQELTFGPAGTMGADATFVIDFVGDQPAITLPFTNEDGETEFDTLEVKAILYDENNKLIEDSLLSSTYTITWDWYCAPEVLSKEGGDTYTNHISRSADTGIQIKLQALEGLNINECYILRATLSGWKNTASNTSYDLIAYLPIPIRTSLNYTYITGADKIVYLSDGTPEYYKNYYILHDINDNKYYDGWSLKTVYSREYKTEQKDGAGNIIVEAGYHNVVEDGVYHLEIASGQDRVKGITWKLKPSPLYYEGMVTYFAAQCAVNGAVQWTQPILIIQSRYFSSMVNDWDGKTIHFDQENGDILASRIGAGRKNEQNQFSGVLLGDWGEKVKEGVIRNTGLYGFNNGLLSFGFKDDGTAFIGTKKRGQLIFDGTESTITSASYRDGNSSGMLLDFDNPMIKLRQYSVDVVPLVEKQVESYVFYGNYSTEQSWKDATRDANGTNQKILYIEDDTQSSGYRSVSSWSENIAGKNLYEKVIVTSIVDPVVGLKSQEDLNAAMSKANITYFLVVKENPNTNSNNIADNYDRVSVWDSTKYNDKTQFYYPSEKSQSRIVELNATANTLYPLKIGNKFYIEWDGTLHATNGKFSGEINATSGTISGTLNVSGHLKGGTISGATIYGSSVNTTYLYADLGSVGGWNINSSKIYKGSMYLDSSTQTINGGTIQGSTLQAQSGTMRLNSYLQVGGGYFGQLDSDSSVAGEGIGLFYSPAGSLKPDVESICEIKATATNCGLNYLKNWIALNSDCINFGGPIKLSNNVTGSSYGDKHPSEAVTNPITGQIYFKIP